MIIVPTTQHLLLSCGIEAGRRKTRRRCNIWRVIKAFCTVFLNIYIQTIAVCWNTLSNGSHWVHLLKINPSEQVPHAYLSSSLQTTKIFWHGQNCQIVPVWLSRLDPGENKKWTGECITSAGVHSRNEVNVLWLSSYFHTVVNIRFCWHKEGPQFTIRRKDLSLLGCTTEGQNPNKKWRRLTNRTNSSQASEL